MANTSGAPPVLVAPIPAQPPRTELNLVDASIGPENPTRDFAGQPISTWTGGVTWWPENVNIGGAVDPCGGFGSPLAPAANLGPQAALAIFIWEAAKCTSAQYADVAEAVRRARVLLMANSSQRLAKELWRGDIIAANNWSNPFFTRNAAGGPFTSPAATPPVVKQVAAGATVNPIAALAALEQGIASYGTGARGMIHCTRRTAVVWEQNHLLNREGGLLLTASGNIVVADAGYDGSAPSASGTIDHAQTADATGILQWAYATSMVQTFLSDIETSEGARANDEALHMASQMNADARTIDRLRNDRIVIASRYALAIFDPAILVGVKIDLSLDLTDTTHWSATLP